MQDIRGSPIFLRKIFTYIIEGKGASQMELNLTKAKKEEIRKAVKELMEKENVTYDDWLFEHELTYLLGNVTQLTKPKKQTGEWNR